MTTLTPEFRLGILGGGQLGRMLAYAAFRLGIGVAVFERAPGSPTAQVTPCSFVGDWNDAGQLAGFAAASQLITVENEFIDAGVLAALEAQGKPVFPSAHTLGLVQDKLVQKRTFAAQGLPVVPFAEAAKAGQVVAFGAEMGYPLILKARRDGYDGYGNRAVAGPEAVDPALAELGFPVREVMVEAHLDFAAELAVMVARGRDDGMATYPVVETVQQNHICKVVKAPAAVAPAIGEQAERLARAAVEAVRGVGIFGVEMFLARDGRVLINEIAPRPHNSGHYTIEACVTSQFENHLRAILGLPLGETAMVAPAAVMVNLLGKRQGPAVLEGLAATLERPGLHVHVYGKAEARVGRKMGHVTVLGERQEDCLAAAQAADAALVL